MKLMRSLLLASATGLVAVSGASAADLGGIKKPAPAEYVRVCNAYGAGFFYIPGTQTCLKVGGRARFDYEYASNLNQNDGNTSGSGFRSVGRLVLDARTQSEYGPVRAFVRIDTEYRTGHYATGSGERYGLGFRTGATVGAVGSGYAQKQTVVNLESAFVQFAGFTAGRLTSFFEFGADQSYRGYAGIAGYSVNQLAYTATFGSGFSATIAVEDPVNRQNAIGYAASGVNSYFVTAAGLGAQSAAGHSYYGGNKAMPDIVGALRVDQGWGSAQLSGLVHAVNYGYAANGLNPDTDYGFAVQGGVKVNVPMLAPGDALWLQAAYAQGVTEVLISSYCGYGTTSICGTGKNGSWTSGLAVVDAVYGGTPALGFSTKLTSGYALTAAFQHYWTPTIRSSITGGYSKIDYAGSTGLADNTLWTGAFNTTWSPIAGLDIGGEIGYVNLRGGNGKNAAGIAKNGPGYFGGASNDQWFGRIRVQRDF